MQSNDDKETQASPLEKEIRAALAQHWAASDANDFATEHQIYRKDAILDYPQSGERICGRAKIQASRTLQPSKKRFKVQRAMDWLDGSLRTPNHKCFRLYMM